MADRGARLRVVKWLSAVGAGKREALSAPSRRALPVDPPRGMRGFAVGIEGKALVPSVHSQHKEVSAPCRFSP